MYKPFYTFYEKSNDTLINDNRQRIIENAFLVHRLHLNHLC
jgi:hypothetical protein